MLQQISFCGCKSIVTCIHIFGDNNSFVYQSGKFSKLCNQFFVVIFFREVFDVFKGVAYHAASLSFTI